MKEDKSTKKGKKIYFNDYKKELIERKMSEVVKTDIINEFNIRNGKGLTSPTSGTTTEESRLLTDYIDKANIFTISKQDVRRGKNLKLRKFLKSKRNQQVEIYSKCGSESRYKEGKVSTIGRDFVMLTNLKERVWIPYSTIESANNPFGIPTYSNTHQHYLYDNQLRKKLIQQFGETVAKRDVLIQQFYEESMQTNLDSWKDTWVVVHLNEILKKVGKIVSSKDDILHIAFFGKEEHMNLKDVQYVETIRLLTLFTYMFKHSEKKHKN